MAISVTVVIPNFNGSALLRRNLPTVIRYAKQYDISTEILVVDDGSSDDSLDVLSQEFANVRVIAHQANLGFSEAASSGISASNTELIFLLNSDVELTMDCLTTMARYFQDEETFSVTPLIRNEDGTVNRHAWNRRVFFKGDLRPVSWTLSSALDMKDKSGKLLTVYASGGSMLLRKSMFLELDGFHPIFKPFYGEDYDLGLRAWAMGWKSYFEPSVELIHQSQGSIKDNVRRDYVKQIRRRNRYLLEWLHFPIGQLFLFTLPRYIWRLLGELLILDLVNLRGFRDALTQLPALRRARMRLEECRKLDFISMIREANR